MAASERLLTLPTARFLSRRALPSGEIYASVAEHKKILLAVVMISGAINLLYLSPAIYMLQIYDRVLNSQSVATLTALTLLVIGLFIVLGVLEHYRSLMMSGVGIRMDSKLSARVFTAAYSRQLKVADNQSSQALWDLNQVRNFFSGPGLVALMDLPWLPIFILVIFLLHPWLGIFATLGALLIFILTVIAERSAKEPTARSQQLSIASNGLAATQLRNADVICAMGMLPQLFRRWKAMHTNAITQQTTAIERVSTLGGSTRVLRLILQSGTLGLGAYLALYGEISAGAMIAAAILTTRALSPMESVIAHWKSLMNTRSSVLRLESLLEEFPSKPEGMSLPKPTGLVTAENVYVTPPNQSFPVIKGVSFDMGPAEVVGITGPSAAGKSTLAKALLGVWPTMGGKIRLNGADISRWSRAEIGGELGYLPQDVELFSGTVSENICRFQEVDSEKCIAAASIAGIHNIILRFPEGYDTIIGDGGLRLSGGQQQLIGLARAIYGEPPLVVLDEPDSNLDKDGEINLIHAINHLRTHGSTIVLISHRPKLLKISDRIMLLKDGQIEHVHVQQKQKVH